MFIRRNRNRVLTFTAAGALALGSLSLTGCDMNGDDQGADVEDIEETDGVDDTEETDDAEGTDDADNAYNGPYNDEFLAEIDSYVGESVTMSAEVAQTFTDLAFTIVGVAGEADPLLVIDGDSEEDLEIGTTVQVSGVVEAAFDISEVEDEWDIDLDDDLFGDWEGLHYIDADRVEALVED